MEPEEENMTLEERIKRAKKIASVKKVSDEGQIVDDEKRGEREYEVLSYHGTPWGH